MSIIKVAPIGERVVEVNVADNTSVCEILRIAGVMCNDRTIAVNNSPATFDTLVSGDAVITLANKMKGGK